MSLKHETLWFRVAVAAIAVVALVILAASLHGRHRPPRDDVELPSVAGPAPQTPAR